MVRGPPPLREIKFFRRKKDPPLHRWRADDGCGYGDGCSSLAEDVSTSSFSDSASSTYEEDLPIKRTNTNTRKRNSVHSGDSPPKLPTIPKSKPEQARAAAAAAVDSQAPSKPQRRGSICPNDNEDENDAPPFLSPKIASGPVRKTPKKSSGFRITSKNASRACHDEPVDTIDIPNIRLKPITFMNNNSNNDSAQQRNNGGVMAHEGMAQVLQNVIGINDTNTNINTNINANKATGADKDVTVLFAIRRPGCGNCREHGIALANLCDSMANTNTNTGTNANINLLGAIKETKVDDKALLEFYTDYFPFPLYKDDQWDLFLHACGNQKLTVWDFIAQAPKLTARYKRKQVRNVPFGGDLWTRGGILFFDARGQLQFVYYEKYGDELNLEAIEWAIRQCQKINTRYNMQQQAPQLPQRCGSSNGNQNTAILADMAPTKPARR